ncbi:putative dynamin GTPase [Annulohypoxylon nitens]|nr:putative dynamin GTPase [Annulohypoxylon nitens]
MSSARTNMIAEGARLSISELSSAWLTQRLKQIYKARANGVGEEVPPLQIVACGNRSSGKSSILERLTGIPFSLGDGKCTRFPIEIVLRHTDAPLPQQVTATILPHDDRSLELQHESRKYHKKLTDLSELPSIIEEVSTLIQAPHPATSETDDSVVTDILRIQFTASTVFDITIVDLPGLEPLWVSDDEENVEEIQDGKTRDDDLFLRLVVESYLSRPNTIILAILDATTKFDYDKQSSIYLLCDHDPVSHRSIGILTKADLVNPENKHDIATELSLLDGYLPDLQLFLPIPPSEPRHKIDPFYQGTWNKNRLHWDNEGLDSLKTFIQEFLEEQIERELPKVLDEIKAKLNEVEKELRLLGNERCTISQIRSSLLEMGMRFQQLAQAAYDGHYQGVTTDFFSVKENRLRLQVHTANEEFSKYMHNHGERRKQTKPPDKYKHSQSADKFYPMQSYQTEAQIMDWIKKTGDENRGRELPGSLQDAPIAELFHEQSSRWPAIAENFAKRVDEMVTVWVTEAVREVTDENRLRHQIIILCQKGLEETRKFAYGELEKLIDDESGPPMTYSEIHMSNMQKFWDACRMETLKSVIPDAIEKAWDSSKPLLPSKTEMAEKTVVQFQRISSSADEPDLSFEDTKIVLDSYYEVAMNTFIDNVCRQVIERHFMKRLKSIFSPQTIVELSDDDLLLIGSEPRTRQNRRALLEMTAQSLRESLSDLQKPSL